LSSGECVCSQGYSQTIEFDLLNPAQPPDPRFSPCDVMGDAVQVLWGVAAASGALALVLQVRLWRVWIKAGNQPPMLSFIVRSALCAVGGGYRVALGTALILFDPFFSFVLVNWVVAGVACMVTSLIWRLEIFAKINVEVCDGETPLGIGFQRKIMKWTEAAFFLCMNGSVVVAFLRPESDRALMLRWILVSFLPFISLIGFAMFHAFSQLEKELRKFTGNLGLVLAVSAREHKTNVVGPAADPARPGMLRQDTSARAEQQRAFFAFAKRTVALVNTALVLFEVLYAVSDPIFYLGKYSVPLTLAIVELVFVAATVRQLRVQEARLAEQMERASKRKARRNVVAPQAAPAQALAHRDINSASASGPDAASASASASASACACTSPSASASASASDTPAAAAAAAGGHGARPDVPRGRQK
jgi:hypothetical protein